MGKHLEMISTEYLETYIKKCKVNWFDVFQKLRLKSDFTKEDFNYYVLVSSFYSSKIEGNKLDMDSFFTKRKISRFNKGKDFTEIENLAKAYRFASVNKLNKANLLKSHKILSKTLITDKGVIRNHEEWVIDKASGKPAYLAVEPEFVKKEFNKLFTDINELMKRELSHKEVFYYASMIHLWFVKIHPFGDGNGRVARLLEKWFIVSKLGMSGWSIRSEKYYYDHRPDYYENVALGYNYYVFHWDRCMPFLLMLPEALKQSLK